MSTATGLRIGELAARCGQSAHTIRWYDAQGLIPGIIRDQAGQRRFNARHVQWLALVERLRRTGMSIAQIRAYARLVQKGSAEMPRQRDLLREHRARVATTIAAWQDALALIDAKLAFYEVWMATGKRPASDAREAILRAAARTTRPAARARTRNGRLS